MSKICFLVGHGKSKSGGYDPGACAGGCEEYRIAKEIAEYAATYYNANYSEHADILNADASLYLTDRIKAVNAAGYDFVAEIHLNAGGGTGTECYYHVGGINGRVYAEAICKAIAAAFGVKNRGAKTKIGAGGKDYFAIIRETGCTAVLVETLFIDSSDLDKLRTPEGQALCGEAIAKAVAEVRGAKRKPAPAPTGSGKLYRVQVGAYSQRAHAEAMAEKIRAAGFADVIIKCE